VTSEFFPEPYRTAFMETNGYDPHVERRLDVCDLHLSDPELCEKHVLEPAKGVVARDVEDKLRAELTHPICGRYPALPSWFSENSKTGRNSGVSVGVTPLIPDRKFRISNHDISSSR
jgi:hypothetical protein